MTQFLIIPADRVSELDAINAAHNDRQCTFKETTGGVRLTSADKMNDVYWADYHAFLNSLEPFEGDPEWPTPIDEEF